MEVKLSSKKWKFHESQPMRSTKVCDTNSTNLCILVVE